MTVKRVKNFIGLCACEGCRKRFINCAEIRFNKKGGEIVKPPFNVRRFWLCDEHTWELANDILKAGGIYTNE